MTEQGFKGVLDFWFPERSRSVDPEDIRQQVLWWFRGGAAAEIVRRFTTLLARAERGELDHWAGEASSRLALVIVLDQFSRTVHRGTPCAYANDPKVLRLARDGIEKGHLAALSSDWERTFFVVPLGHSEDLESHELAVRLVDELVRTCRPEHRWIHEHSASQARGHRDVIARFGRHPHRNAILGRQSTPEELAYVAAGEFVHLRAPPAKL